MAGNADFQTLATAALNNYTKGKLADAVTSNIPFLHYLMEKGLIKCKGGKQLELPIMYNKKSSVSFSGMEQLPIVYTEGLTAVIYDWKEVGDMAVCKQSDLDKASGEFEKQNIVNTEILRTEKSITEALAIMLASDGTGNGGKDILGLKAIVASTAGTTLAGIDSSVDTFWDNYRNTSVGSFTTNGIIALGRAMREVRRGTDRTNLILAGDDVFGYMEDKAYSHAFHQNSSLADLGFAALKFHGVDVLHDPTIDADQIYGLNLDWLGFYVLDRSPDTAINGKPINVKEKMFSSSAFADLRSTSGQRAQAAMIHTMCQLATNDRARHFVLSGITA